MKRKCLKLLSWYIFAKETPERRLYLILYVSTYCPWTPKPNSAPLCWQCPQPHCSPLKRRRSELWGALVGPLHADPTAAQTLYSRTQPVQQLRSVGFLSTSQRCHRPKRKNLWASCSPPPSPRQETENRCPQWKCFAPGNFSSPCFYSKGTEGMEEEHERTLFFFFICPDGKPLVLRQGLQK